MAERAGLCSNTQVIQIAGSGHWTHHEQSRHGTDILTLF